jgi:hypothetical protein
MKREICMMVMMLGFAIAVVAGMFWVFIRINPLGWATFFGLGLMCGGMLTDDWLAEKMRR